MSRIVNGNADRCSGIHQNPSDTFSCLRCRSGIPVATAILSVAVESKVPTRAEFTSLLVLTAGVMIAVCEGAKGSLRGICFASLGMLSNAVRRQISK